MTQLDQCATQTSLLYPETLSTSFYVPTPSTPHYRGRIATQMSGNTDSVSITSSVLQQIVY